MKKILLAVDNEKILNKVNIKELNEEKADIKKIQYREGILEILKIDKNIDTIILCENLLGKISIEDLIRKIKTVNKNINIIFILEKNDIKKEQELKKLEIKNIYKLKNKKNTKNKNKTKRIITFFGERNLEIIYLIIFYLIQKNKKILLIDFKKEKLNEKNLFLKYGVKEILIDVNKKNIIKMLNKKTEEGIKNYDYILVNSCRIKNNEIINNLIEKNTKVIYFVNNSFLGIKECKEFISRTKNSNNETKLSLHIIKIKDYFNSINKDILKNMFGKIYNINEIKYKKNYFKIEENLLKDKKIKINRKIRKIIKLIIN